jgi:hypothetical protein
MSKSAPRLTAVRNSGRQARNAVLSQERGVKQDPSLCATEHLSEGAAVLIVVEYQITASLPRQRWTATERDSFPPPPSGGGIAANALGNLIGHWRAGNVKWPCAATFAAALEKLDRVDTRTFSHNPTYGGQAPATRTRFVAFSGAKSPTRKVAALLGHSLWPVASRMIILSKF